MKENKLIEEMKSKIIYLDSDSNKYYSTCFCVSTLENGTLAFVLKEDVQVWNNCINGLYKSLCKVEKDVSLEEFRDYIRNSLRKNEFNDFESIKKHYEKRPLEEYAFIKVAYGMTINDADIKEYKGIILIKKDFIEEYIKKNVLNSEMASHFYNELKTDDDVVYMNIKCVAKDSYKAQEYAVDKFKLIDTCFRFLLKYSNSDKLRFGFYNLNYESSSGMYGYNDHLFISMSEYKESLCLDTFFDFLFESDLSNKVWELMENKNLNDMEMRIKEAIIWLSEAAHQNDDGIAYMQCFLALEAILMEQDGFINKSITAQISEYVAFLLGIEREERIRIEKEMKELYSIRSSIAHGKNKKGIEQELKRIFMIVKLIVLRFLNDERLIKIRNIKELRELITNLKFK